MSGNKTHQQQRDILQKRVDTANADEDFDPRPDLKAQEAGLDRGGAARPVRRLADDDDPAMRGERQESHHHKNAGRPDGGGG